MDSMGVSDGYKAEKSSGLLKIESFGFVNLWTGGRVVKVCDAFIGIAAELRGIQESCPDYYLISLRPNRLRYGRENGAKFEFWPFHTERRRLFWPVLWPCMVPRWCPM